ALASAAQRHFDLGEYAAAISDWRDAYRLEPHPGLLYNLAQAYRLSGDCVTATLLYKNFLRLAPGSPHRADAETNLDAIADCAERGDASGVHPASDEGSMPSSVEVPTVEVPT